jgi:amino acid transporter
MKNEILDEIEKEIESPKFALKSYDQFWKSIIVYAGMLILFLLFFIIMNLRINISFSLMLFIILLIGMFGFVFNFFGLANFFRSRTNKEYLSWKLYFGSFGNIILFLCWIWVLFFLNPFTSDGCFGGY